MSIFLAKGNNPFDQFENFLTNDVIKGLLSIVTPLAVIGILVTAAGMYLSQEEHSRDRFKKALISIVVITIVCFMAQGIITWIGQSFKG
ncbi:TrbC/VirB2 family protein [Hazenella coriacea]|nr:TrbC/VirB2 family protein [Hazenella coriacea]